MKYLLIASLVFISSCDISVKEVMKLDMPFSCKMTIVCWKQFKKDSKIACEKFAERCKDDAKTYTFKK